MPERVQVRRVKGWRLPAGCVYVGRPTRFGNPFRAEAQPGGREEAVRRFEDWLHESAEGRELLASARAELRGKPLACWCPLTAPCHADVWLRLVNRLQRQSLTAP